MDQNRLNTDIEDSECPICFEKKESTYYMNCKHNICLSCTIKIYKNNEYFFCPICRQKKDILTINNVYYLHDFGLFDSSIIFTPFNVSKYDAENNIKYNKKYIIVIPKKNVLLLVMCVYKAIFAADMQIISIKKNDRLLAKNVDNIISYNYNNYDKIYFDSFFDHDDCLIYS